MVARGAVGRRRIETLALFLVCFGLAPTPAFAPAKLASGTVPLSTLMLMLGGAMFVLRAGSEMVRRGPATLLLTLGLASLADGVYGVARGATVLRSLWGVSGVVELFAGLAVGYWAISHPDNCRRLYRWIAVTTLITAAAVVLTQFSGLSLINARVQEVAQGGAQGGSAARVVVSSAEVSLTLLVISFAIYLTTGKWGRLGRFVTISCTALLYATFTRNLLGISLVAVVLIAFELSRAGYPAFGRLAAATYVVSLIVTLVSVIGLAAFPGAAHDVQKQLNGYSSRVLQHFDLVPSYSTSWGYRLREDSAALDNLSGHELFGTGLGNPYRRPFLNEDYKDFGPSGGVYYIHNAYLWVWTKLGLLGITCYLAFIFLAFRGYSRWRRLRRGDSSPAEQCLVSAAFVTLLALLLRSIVTPSIATGDGAAVFGFLLAVLWSAGEAER